MKDNAKRLAFSNDRPFLTIHRNCGNVNKNKTESVLKSDFETTFLGAPEISNMCPYRSQVMIVNADNTRGEYRYREVELCAIASETDPEEDGVNGNI